VFFDSHSAGVYLRDKTDVAFRPFGLDIFDKLSRVCDEVRFRLEREQDALHSNAIALPALPVGTRAQKTIAALTALTSVDVVRQLAVLNAEEVSRLTTLRERQRDVRAVDPKARSRELLLQARRVDRVVEHMAKIERVTGAAAVANVAEAAQALRVATAAVESSEVVS
jgi:hypothetical protein